MQKQLAVWKLIRECLSKDIPVMLLYVLESAGSSPGREGFCMAVNANGEMKGSIGGGIMEHKFVEMAREKLKQNQREQSVRRQVHDKTVSKDQSGMICSGEQTIFIYHVQLKELHYVQDIVECLENNKNGLLQLSPGGLLFSKEVPENDFTYFFQSNEDWMYREKIGYKNHLYIIGAGHCSLALSRMMSMMDFYIHLYDDRNNLNTFDQNEFAHEKKILNDYSEVKDIISSSQYVVVMTMGYRTDDIVVRALMNKQLKYFGVLGSKKKIEKMFTTYRQEGIDESVLNNIHAPIGIQINSQTPEEIAISIAAEIIKVKNA